MQHQHRSHCCLKIQYKDTSILILLINSLFSNSPLDFLEHQVECGSETLQNRGIPGTEYTDILWAWKKLQG